MRENEREREIISSVENTARFIAIIKVDFVRLSCSQMIPAK